MQMIILILVICVIFIIAMKKADYESMQEQRKKNLETIRYTIKNWPNGYKKLFGSTYNLESLSQEIFVE